MKRVSIIRNKSAKYPAHSPFNPSEKYPECPFKKTSPKNYVYSMVRESLRSLGMDNANFSTSKWNPLGEIIKPGDKVLIKPNFARNFHPKKKNIFSVITHPSVIRAMVDYVYIALKGKGEIIIADAPLLDTDFEKIVKLTGLTEITKMYKDELNFKIGVFDLRNCRHDYSKSDFMPQTVDLPGDPLGCSLVDLKNKSKFSGFGGCDSLHGLDYDFKMMRKHHNRKNHVYAISNTLLTADVVISLPKMKVHKKAGVTLNQKNMLGICCDKRYVPHFNTGALNAGGDEMPGSEEQARYSKRKMIEALLSGKKLPADLKLKNILENKTVDMLPAGDWHGNDTIWRAILDINNIVKYADKKGRIKKSPQRKFFSIIDGIISGEKEGPLEPSPKNTGILVSGYDFSEVDLAAIRKMGFDYKKIPQYANSSSFQGIIKELSTQKKTEPAPFKPPFGWHRHIEL